MTKRYTNEQFNNEIYGLKRVKDIKWEDFRVGMRFCSFTLLFNKNYAYKDIPKGERVFYRKVAKIAYIGKNYLVMERQEAHSSFLGSPYIILQEIYKDTQTASYLMREEDK